MKTRYVYVVNFRYSYEGESTEAVYATRKLAEQHRWGGDEKVIYKMPVRASVARKYKPPEAV